MLCPHTVSSASAHTKESTGKHGKIRGQPNCELIKDYKLIINSCLVKGSSSKSGKPCVILASNANFLQNVSNHFLNFTLLSPSASCVILLLIFQQHRVLESQYQTSSSILLVKMVTPISFSLALWLESYSITVNATVGA